MAEESGLAKRMVERRVLELAQAVLTKLPEVRKEDPTAIGVSELIKANCKRVLRK